MKYLVGFWVTVAVLYAYATRHPLPGSPLPAWADAVGGALILALPISMLCRLLTKKIGGMRARGIELLVLLALAGGFWAVSISVAPDPRVVAPVRFWLGLTVELWATMFLPFVGSVAVVEWIQDRKRRSHA